MPFVSFPSSRIVRSLRRRGAPLGLSLAALGACISARPAPAVRPGGASRPSLVVLLTVDQMRPEYLTRFGALPGGLGRLYRAGAVFTAAYQDHANTETAPGHASLLSGRFPAHTGILLNDLGVPDSSAPLLGGGGPGASPFRFRGTTLVDWMRAADPGSRALSVSRKDRGAILPIGRSRQSVFWYAPVGRFTTSTYYADTLPDWVMRFNARRLPQRFMGQRWDPLLPASAYAEADTVSVEYGGLEPAFPHSLATDSATAMAELLQFPWMDEITLALALDGVNAMALGAQSSTDLLAVSLSSTDAVGHRFGPDSREMHDQILRLDRSLGIFLDSLFRLRDSTRVVLALTADHGSTPWPELAPPTARPRAARVDLSGLLDTLRAGLRARGVAGHGIEFDNGIAWLDRPALARAGVNGDSLLAAFVSAVRGRAGVRRVDYVRDLLQADTTIDVAVRRWRHAIPPDAHVDVAVTLYPYSVWWGGWVQHGSGNELDAHVPLILWGAPFRAGRFADTVRTVDLAPTLARVLGIVPLEPLDGHVLRGALGVPR